MLYRTPCLILLHMALALAVFWTPWKRNDGQMPLGILRRLEQSGELFPVYVQANTRFQESGRVDHDAATPPQRLCCTACKWEFLLLAVGIGPEGWKIHMAYCRLVQVEYVCEREVNVKPSLFKSTAERGYSASTLRHMTRNMTRTYDTNV